MSFVVTDSWTTAPNDKGCPYCRFSRFRSSVSSILAIRQFEANPLFDSRPCAARSASACRHAVMLARYPSGFNFDCDRKSAYSAGSLAL